MSNRHTYIPIVDGRPNAQDFFTYSIWRPTNDICYQITTEWDNLVVRLVDLLAAQLGIDEQIARRDLKIILIDNRGRQWAQMPSAGLQQLMFAVQGGGRLVYYMDVGRQARDAERYQGYYDSYGNYLRA